MNFPDRELEYELVSADTSGEFEVLSLTIKPGGTTSATANTHASEECAVVLRGEVVAEVAGQAYALEAGDSIKIHRELPHRFINERNRGRRGPDHHQPAHVLIEARGAGHPEGGAAPSTDLGPQDPPQRRADGLAAHRPRMPRASRTASTPTAARVGSS